VAELATDLSIQYDKDMEDVAKAILAAAKLLKSKPSKSLEELAHQFVVGEVYLEKEV
jgi:hypothetical protein